jgi:hypothetical protein
MCDKIRQEGWSDSELYAKLLVLFSFLSRSLMNLAARLE